LGLLLLWFTKKQKAGKIIVSIGVGLAIIFSYGTFQDILLRSLENKYPPLINFQEVDDVKWVVVLGSGHTSAPELPVTDQISKTALSRLIEGIRIHRNLSGSKLILSGGGGFDPVPNARIMADVAYVLGISDSDMVLEPNSKDTKDEAVLIQKIVKNEKFILVTSASHMPRSMALFKKLGMQPIPAPTDHAMKRRQGIHPGVFFPSSGKIRNAELVFHEYLGLAWAKLRGQI
jgi:uncharacterized SAM-binding protein YcdF (DUF218 family)